MRRSLLALGATASAVVPALAADPPRPVVAPLHPCLPAVIVPPCPPLGGPPGSAVVPGTPGVTSGVPAVPGTMPTFPGTPTTPGSIPGQPTFPGTPGGSTGGAPIQPFNPDAPSPGVGGAPALAAPAVTADAGSSFARQSEGGTQAAATFAPSMFGDVLGARSVSVRLNTPFAATFTALSGLEKTASGVGRVVDPNTGTIRFGGGNSGIRDSGPITIQNNSDLTFVQPTDASGTVADTTFARNALQSLLSAGQLTPAQIATFNQLTPEQRNQLLRNRGQINQTITQSTKGLAIRTLTVSPITATTLPPVEADGPVTYAGELVGNQNVPLPGGSTFVGRVKISEDTSPLPRDRVIFAYDHFDNVPFTPTGFTVNRFQFGIEKTFLDGRWSAEFRLPFAGTIASTNVQGFEVGHTEFGNVRFALKRIFSQNTALTTTSGIAVTLPTAADQVVLSSFDRSVLYRFENQQVTVEPFVAALYTPTSRLFGQTWTSVNFDVSGGELTYNTAVFGGSGRERIFDVPYLSVDQQVGYWLIQRDYGRLRGLAPFAELHWNYAIAQNELIRQVNDQLPANGLSVNAVATYELNLIAGVLMQVGDNLNVSIGASAPLLQRPDRTFDAQVGVRANYLFGRTARARNPIYAINSY